VEDFMAKKPLDDPNNVLHYLLVTHAPLINKSIKSLRAKGHLPPQEEMDDWELHEAGMRGLMEAVTKYDPKLGPFATYASSSIRGRIQSHADSMHQIPKHIRMQAKRFGEMQRHPATQATAPATPAASQPATPTAESVPAQSAGAKPKA
jgi:DNA-directed RNA polymerase specialized sigma subunit